MINGNSDSLTGIVSLSFVIYGEEESRFTSTEKTSMNISEHYVSKSVLWHSPQSSNGLLIQSNKDIIRVHITRSSQDELSGRGVAKVFYPTVVSTLWRV